MRASGILQSPFHAKQSDAGAVFGEQDGWRLPLRFGAWHEEVREFRARAGVCDLSHVGRIRIRGDGALDLLDTACTADTVHQEDDTAADSLLCDDKGGIIDAVRILRMEDSWMVLTSPAARQGVLEHLSERAEGLGAKVDDQTLKTAMVAVAGPEAPQLLDAALPMKVSDMPDGAVKVGSLLIAKYIAFRTTRCGAWSLEVILPTLMAGQAWRYITRKAGANSVRPIGEIAQDVLRIEAGQGRLGYEINRMIDPFLAGLEGRIAWGHEFEGKQALEKMRSHVPQRRLIGLRIADCGVRIADLAGFEAESTGTGLIPRLGWAVCRDDGGQAGTVTSGTFSPTLDSLVCLAYVSSDLAAPGTSVSVGPEGPQYPAKVVELPFVK